MGKDSLSSSSRLTLKSVGITLKPVTFPPGFAKLSASPVREWIAGGHDDGQRLGNPSSRQSAARRGRDDDIDLLAHELGGEIGKPFSFAFSVTVYEDNVFTFRVTALAQTLLE